METRNRLVIPWNGQKVARSMPVGMVAVALVVATLFVTTLLGTRTTRPAPSAAYAVQSQHEQAPDAIERNDVYSAALAAREHESADSGDRNARLTYGQMLVRFNDLTPDARDRNIALSGR